MQALYSASFGTVLNYMYMYMYTIQQLETFRRSQIQLCTFLSQKDFVELIFVKVERSLHLYVQCNHKWGRKEIMDKFFANESR